MEFSFTKLHGNGNDFILIDEYEKEVIPDDFKAELLRNIVTDDLELEVMVYYTSQNQPKPI
jgi:diaminopimelate epimerase